MVMLIVLGKGDEGDRDHNDDDRDSNHDDHNDDCGEDDDDDDDDDICVMHAVAEICWA